MLTEIPLLKIYSDRIVKFYPPVFTAKSSETIEKVKKNLSHEKLTGKISKNTTRFIRQKLDIFINSCLTAYYNNITDSAAKKRLPIFVTLTLSSTQRHTDNEIKRNMLDQFLHWAKYNFDVKYYFWRAEAQKNDNIHFHLILDNFIPYAEIQRAWNEIQKNNGYLKEYIEKRGHGNAPSTHVKSVNAVNNFVEYVIKYATKDENHRPVTGRVWGMSDSLRKISSLTIDLDSEIWSEIQVLQSKKAVKEFHKDYASVYFVKKGILGNDDMPYTHNLLIEFYKEMFVKLYASEGEIIEDKLSDNEIAYFIDEQLESVTFKENQQEHYEQLSLFLDASLFAPASVCTAYSLYH